MRIHATAVVLSALAVLSAGAQQPPVRFKVDVSLVEVDVIVTDKDGKAVRGLSKEDFQILEDGRPQQISAFTMVDIPVVRADAPRPAATLVEADVASNLEEFDGRLFVIVLDDLQTAFANTPHVRRAAREFVVQYVGGNDLVAVMHTAAGGIHGQALTRSKARVLKVIDAFTGNKLPSATRMKAEDYQNQQYIPPEFRKPPTDSSDSVRAHRARSSLDSLARASDWVGRIGGRRKAIVYFGEGIDYDLQESITVGEAGVKRDIPAIQTAMRDLIASAARAGVSVYTIDPRGLPTGMEEAISISGSWDPASVTGPGLTTLMDEMHRAHASMRTISESTGGLAILNRNDFASAFERIIDDNSTYYLLGYYESKKPRPGQYPRLDVRMTRPGLKARARRGYLAPTRVGAPATSADSKISAPLRDALHSPVPVTGLGLSVFAAAFRGHTREASVAVVIEIDPARLRFVERAGRFDSDIELTMTPVDVASASARYTLVDTARLRLLPDTHARVAANGVRFTRRLVLPPGRYRLAFGAREGNGGAIGTVFTDLDVPDFFEPPLQMSGIALASNETTERIRTVTDEPGVTDVLPGSATAVREFAADDTLSIFAEVYDNDVKAPHRVAIRTTLSAHDGREVFTGYDERKTPGSGPAGWVHFLKIPLSRFAPGRYVLQIEARRLLVSGGVTARQVEIRVR